MVDNKIVSAYQQAMMDATINAAMYGHGFIRISKTETEFQVTCINPDEYKDHAELMTWITENKHTSQKP